VKPLDPAMIEDAARHHLVVTVEDGVRDGGAGSLVAGEIERRRIASGLAAPQFEILGVPEEFIPHGKPDQLLASLGLDATGIERSIRAALAT
jgi:1-deoxy-D-xylulose-5-phosphate synthase